MHQSPSAENREGSNNAVMELDLLVFQKIMDRFFKDKVKIKNLINGKNLENWFEN